jgi:hypothetical protein
MAYFTTVEFRDVMPDMASAANYPDARVELARDAIESLIEQVCGTSFIERTVTETVDGSGRNGILLSSAYVRSITSVTIDGVLETGYDYTFESGLLERNTTGGFTPSSWVCGRRNIVVVYTAGYSTAPPADLKMATMLATRDRVLVLSGAGGQSSRATSISNELGGTTQFSIANADNPTGLPEADATIMRWANYVRVPGIA